MATITRFEDIKAWQEARKMVVSVYALTYKGELAKDYALRDQMRRAAISVPSNIAEGFERGGNKEFCQFLSHAKGSSGELRSQLYNALDLGYCTDRGIQCPAPNRRRDQQNDLRIFRLPSTGACQRPEIQILNIHFKLQTVVSSTSNFKLQTE